jgi:hypothetical protein
MPPKVEVDGKWSVNEGGRTIEAYSRDNRHATGYIITISRTRSSANPGTIAVVKGVQKMGIQMDRMAGGHGGVGNFADLANTVQ